MQNRTYRNSLSRHVLKERSRTLLGRHTDSALQDFPEKPHTSSLLKDVLEQTHSEMILQGGRPEDILEESPEEAHSLVSGIMLSRESLQDIAE